MDSIISKNGWIVATKGVLLVMFGWFVILHPTATMMTVTYILGLVLFFSGMTILMEALNSTEIVDNKNALIIEGLVDILLGFSLFVIPIFFAEFLIMLLGAWMLLTATVKIWHSYKESNRVFTSDIFNFKTVLTLIGGVFLLISPIIGIVVLSWIIGIAAALAGLTLLYYAYCKVRYQQS
ncbi:DUF308 domain-containing protein [Saprospiraceae bacterium]|nr:DUF308 domain-containing protein [Saprospiraceae bacterium]